MSKVLQPPDDSDVVLWRAPDVEGAGAMGPAQGARRGHGPPPTAQTLEQIQEFAYDEGFQAGYKDGLNAGAEEAAIRAAQFDQVLCSLAHPVENLDMQVEHELLELAMAIARQLVRRELQTSPDEIIAVVREALKALPSNSSEIRVIMHPEDAQLVRDLMANVKEDNAWRIVEDPALTRGGCRVESDHSRVDATLERRMSQIVASIWGVSRTGDET